jgi:hypothetical protein
MHVLAARPILRLGTAVVAASLIATVALLTIKYGLAWQLPAFALGPDAALLVGAGSRLAAGQLHPRAVRLYNALHSLTGPVALVGLVLASSLPPGWLIGGLVWLAHIVLDRALGYGPRTREGFQRGA